MTQIDITNANDSVERVELDKLGIGTYFLYSDNILFPNNEELFILMSLNNNDNVVRCKDNEIITLNWKKMVTPVRKISIQYEI